MQLTRQANQIEMRKTYNRYSTSNAGKSN